MEKSNGKRVRRDPDTTRKLILDASERIMAEESYAALTTRRVAKDIGINAATVHYYYPTTQDLLIALHKRMTERQVCELEQALAAENPLRALWEFQSDWDQAALSVEVLALAGHRKGIADVISSVTNEAREAHAHLFERTFESGRIDRAIITPVALATIAVAIARTLANEERVGIATGHAEVCQLVDWTLNHLLKPVASDQGPED